MNIVIQKFGGTSLRHIAESGSILSHIERAIHKGESPVIVVSAIGRKGEPYATDTLINELEKINPNIDPKKKDLIMSCGETISAAIVSHFLDSNGIPSEPLMGIQARIVTDANFGSSTIVDINTDPILKLLKDNKTPVVAGFQGASKDMEITTLGRGGSDITAVSLGGYLKAQRVDIFTDVPGVAIIDPQIVPSTKFIQSIDYDNMYNLASNGVNVLHPRAVSIGKNFNIPIHVRSTSLDGHGTVVSSFDSTEYDNIIGIALDKNKEQGVITIFFQEGYANDLRKKFNDYLLIYDEEFLNAIWYDNKVSIVVEPDEIFYFAKDFYRYFFS
ncbi:aspartate kinase [Wansuia hejianensis]|uniref:Aspartokinase n=1 Tax=Wansuia hejianensis TaxID=2763667 RepID=A0A926IN86_9FIRM|nr:aspartate kinase [Wansuia hejianensis]MBC8591391.1 aspartate kinase [Wansuia hejianensis]